MKDLLYTSQGAVPSLPPDPKILVVILRYIGDVLLATPTIQALKEKIPRSLITVVVNPGTEGVLRENPHIHSVLVVPREGWKKQLRFVKLIRSHQFDCVIDLTDGDRAALISRFSGATTRIGFNEEKKWRGRLYSSVVTDVEKGLHRIDRNLQALRRLGLDLATSSPQLYISSQEKSEAIAILRERKVIDSTIETPNSLIMFQPGARYWFKAWSPSRYAELALRLIERFQCSILLGGAPEERHLAETIKKEAKSLPIVLAGSTTLREYAAILQQCRLFIGNDNGPMHMASALGIPVVGVFGPSNPAIWGPRGGKSALLYKGLDCRQCFHPTCHRGDLSCMNLITVDEVFNSAVHMLSE